MIAPPVGFILPSPGPPLSSHHLCPPTRSLISLKIQPPWPTWKAQGSVLPGALFPHLSSWAALHLAPHELISSKSIQVWTSLSSFQGLIQLGWIFSRDSVTFRTSFYPNKNHTLSLTPCKLGLSGLSTPGWGKNNVFFNLGALSSGSAAHCTGQRKKWFPVHPKCSSTKEGHWIHPGFVWAPWPPLVFPYLVPRWQH